MRTKWGVVALLVGVATTAMAIGDDSSSLRSDLADYQVRGASLESSRAVSGCSSCGGGAAVATCSVCSGSSACEADAKTLASMKGSACLTIGGKVDIPLYYTSRQRQIPGPPSRYSNTYFSGEAALYIDAHATQDAKLRIKLDLEDEFDNNQPDDLLEEVYFQWTNIACSGLGASVGKKTVDFGQHRTIGYMKALTAGRAQLFRNNADKYTGAVVSPGFEPNNFYMAGQNLGLPGEVTDQFLLEVSYAFADIAKITATTFQNTADEGNNNAGLGARTSANRGTVGRTTLANRTRDPLFRSYAVKAEVTPFEGLNANISYLSMYDREFATIPARTRNSRALSVGADYQLCVLPLEVFAEYIHGWNWNHIFTNDTDTYQGGVIWGATDKIDLGLMLEHARIDFPGPGTEKVWNYYATAYYKMTGNMKVGVEFMYQRVRDTRLVGTPTRNAYALGFVTSMTF